jgi:hypothetical protein
MFASIRSGWSRVDYGEARDNVRFREEESVWVWVLGEG